MSKSTPLRPPPSGKRLAFLLSLFSTIIWIAAVFSGVRITRRQVGCLPASSSSGTSGGDEAWRFGTACRLQRASVAFAFLGLSVLLPLPPYFSFWGCEGYLLTEKYSLGSLIVLGAMVEISDRPFGGVSADERITAVAEKFREALMDLRAEEEGGGGGGGGEGEKEEV